MPPLKLGVIGLSPGNGHPYSWSAIFNGYDPQQMENCGFPVIPRYLARQHFPDDAIAEARVTHCWAQSGDIARHLAGAALIPNVVDRFTDMLGEVDGVLLARDDAETHLEFAAPFLEAGVPIYIDKPLALSSPEAVRLLDLQRYPGQLFSCSALRYAREFQLPDAKREKLGRLRQIHATVPKDWDKYAVHVIEPALLLAGQSGTIGRTRVWRAEDSTTLAASLGDGLQLLVSTVGAAQAPLALRLMGELGWTDLVFQDAFSAFRSALSEFVQGILHRDVRIEPAFMLEVVGLIEAGRAP